jgi:hypothetical protein
MEKEAERGDQLNAILVGEDSVRVSYENLILMA